VKGGQNMFPYVLWRWNGEEWKSVKAVSSKNTDHCSRFEIVVCVGCHPNDEGIKPE
jgi:hypothetical protein